ncbi:hypothetical protein [Chromatium okenii]|jgi:hypothetical protein|uniref:Uncharacterized protein n=1 Tax=Chromatium okenii TaxID=61644 RepID=A0A2S7XPE2_9GAMM|nr:hypothetical protein [Chromatium okenii]PQJ95599.1 hypothetical protein CXB77_15915 [Chromatium okenii]
MLNDEIVDEIRTIREKHAAQFNFDLRAIFEDLKKSETKHLADGHTFITPSTTYNLSGSKLQQARFSLPRRRIIP